MTGGKRAGSIQAEVANRNGHITMPDLVYNHFFDEAWQMLCTCSNCIGKKDKMLLKHLILTCLS